MSDEVIPEEQINPVAMNIALLREMQKHMISMNADIQSAQAELKVIRRNQECNDVHLKYEVDLSVVHTDKEIADFTKMGLEVNTVTIMPVPSPMSIRLRGLESERIDLEKKESIDVNNQVITRLLVTNVAGSGTARIHAFGKWVK